MSEDRVPLFVRLPREQAAALDRLVDSTGRRKQHLVSELLADQLAVGRIEITEGTGASGEEVLTAAEAAALLRLPLEVLLAEAHAGALPGRELAGEWRFSRAALLSWLAHGESVEKLDGEKRDGLGGETREA
jgi:Helix-turn-helix domain